MALFETEQTINTPINEVWYFFSNPYNLKKVSIPGSGFEVINDAPSTIIKDMIVIHRIYPFPFIRAKWISKIIKVEYPTLFIDEMQKGPFASWKHQHHFEKIDETTTLIKDKIEYSLPFGRLGKVFDFIIRQKLQKSFSYRKNVLNQLF